VILRSARQVGIALVTVSALVGLSAAACGGIRAGQGPAAPCQVPAYEQALVAAYSADPVLDPATFGVTSSGAPNTASSASPGVASSAPSLSSAFRVRRYCDNVGVDHPQTAGYLSVSTSMSADQRDWFPLPVLYQRVEPVLRGLGWAYAGYRDSDVGDRAGVDFCRMIDSVPSVVSLDVNGPRLDTLVGPLPAAATTISIILHSIDGAQRCPDPPSAGGTLTPVTHLPTPKPGTSGQYQMSEFGPAPLRFWLTTDASFGATPASVPGALYVATGKIGYDNFVYDLDPVTGTQLWRVQVRGAVQSRLAVAAGRVYALTTLGSLLSLDARTGAQLWSLAVPQLVRRVGYEDPGTNPLVVAGLVCLGATDGRVHCFDAATGAARWQSPVGVVTSYGRDHELVTAAGRIVAVGDDTTINALDAATGQLRWRFRPVENQSRTIAAFGSSVYAFTAMDLYQLDAMTGRVQWSTYQALGLPIYASPDVPGGLFVDAGSDGRAVDQRTGKVLWASGMDSARTQPSAPGGSQVAAGGDAYIVGMDAATGHILWQVKTGQFQAGAPLITDDLICVSVATQPVNMGNLDLSGMLVVLGRH
jgi:outer membrane protein assembly factor BamB